MKFRGKAIGGSSVLTIIGVLCFATVLVAAGTLISNTLAIENEPVYDNELLIAQGTAAADDWSETDAHYVGDTYTETVAVTPNGYGDDYYVVIDFSVDTAAWTVTATKNTQSVSLTELQDGSGVWYSASQTSISGTDTWVFTFTPAEAHADVDIAITAYSGSY